MSSDRRGVGLDQLRARFDIPDATADKRPGQDIELEKRGLRVVDSLTFESR